MDPFASILLVAVLALVIFSFVREHRSTMDAKKMLEDSVAALGAQFKALHESTLGLWERDRADFKDRLTTAYTQADALFTQNRELLNEMTEQARNAGAAQEMVKQARVELASVLADAQSPPKLPRRVGRENGKLFEDDRFADDPQTVGAGDPG